MLGWLLSLIILSSYKDETTSKKSIGFSALWDWLIYVPITIEDKGRHHIYKNVQ